MALPMLLGAAAKGIVRGGGRAAASRIMGRKKTVKPSAIAPKQKQQGQQQQRGGALVKSPTAGITKAMAPVKQISTGPAAKDDYLGVISEKLLIIEQIVLSVYQAESNNLKQKKKDEQDDARKEKENRLESKPSKPEKKKPTLDQLPKLGVFGWLKRFIGNIIAGIFLKKMVDFAGFLPGIIQFLDTVGNFLATFGVKLIDGLVTFVDFGIKAYNFTIGVIEKGLGPLFGDNAEKVLGLVEKAIFLTAAIAGSMAAESLRDSGGGGGPQTGIRGAAGQVGRVAGTQTTTAAAARRYAARFGRDAAVQRFGPEAVKSLGGKYARSQVTNLGRGLAVKALGKRGAAKAIKTAAGILKPLVKNIPLIGGITEFILSWISGDPIGKAAFKGIGAGLGTWIGGALGTLIPIPGVGTAIGMFLGGTGGSALGGVIYDAIFKDKVPKPSTESVDNFYSEFQEGGKVAPRKKVKRGIDIKKKKKRKLRVAKPSKERLAPLPPMEGLQTQEVKNERAWWDFLGWAGTGGSPEQDKLGPGGKKLAEKVTDVGNKLGENDYFGPILRLTSKVVLDQDVTARDYLNVGRGINLLLDDGMRKGAIGVTGYNEGGTVDNIPQMDVTGWVRKTFEDGLKDDLKKKYVKFSSTKYGTTGPMGEGQYDPATGAFMGGNVQGAPLNMNDKQAFATVYELAKKYKAKFPEIVAAQAMHETGFLSEDLASVFNSTGRTNAFGQTGDRGYGTIPRKNSAIGWTKYPSLDKAVEDNIKLWHRVSNHEQNYEAFETPIEGILAVVGAYSPNKDPANIAKGYTEGSYVHAMQKILMSMGFDPYKANKEKDLSDDAVLERISPIGDNPGAQPVPQGPGGPEGEQINVGGQGIVAIGKDLISKGFSVAEHPDFTKTPTSSGGTYTPGKGSVARVHSGRGHYEGRAIDVTDWRGSMEDSKARYRAVLDSLYQQRDKLNLNMLIHNSWGDWYSPNKSKGGPPGDGGHPEHMHIEVKDKGGFIGKGLFANLGGTEFVTDADSTAALRQVAPGLMMALNQASDKSGIANVLRDYASYEQGSQQTVVMQDESDEEQEQESYGGVSSTPQLPPIIMDSSNPFEFLEYQG